MPELPPIVVVERINSPRLQSGDNAGADLEYIIYNTPDPVAAGGALVDAATVALTAYSGLVLLSSSIEALPANDTTWAGTAKLGLSQVKQPEAGQSTFSFEISVSNQHVTQSLQTISRYALPGKTPPDFKGAIGVTRDSVEGVDVQIPVSTWSETHYLSPDVVTDDYRALLLDHTGKVNVDSFKGYDPGEVLFLGASGSKRGDEYWEVTFKFASSKNVTGLAVGDITAITKNGWDYLWVRYEDAVDGDAAVVVKKPTAIYVERVYASRTLADLGV